MGSDKQFYPTSPKAYVRLMDMYAGESIALGQKALISLQTNRAIGDSGSASVVFENTKGLWSDPDIQKLPTGVDRVDVWDLMYLTKSRITDMQNAEGKAYALRYRSYPALSTESPEAEFFRSIFWCDPVMRDLNDARSRLYQEFLDKVKNGEKIGSEQLKEFYKASYLFSLRSKVEIDLVDYRGYIFSAFTGYVSNFTDTVSPGMAGEISIGCKDWMELWKLTLMVGTKAYFLMEQLQDEQLQQSMATEKQAYQSVLSQQTPDKSFDYILDVINTAHTIEGVANIPDINVTYGTAQRDKKYPIFWTYPQSVKIPGVETPVKPRLLYKDSLWARQSFKKEPVVRDQMEYYQDWRYAQPYLVGPVPFSGNKPQQDIENGYVDSNGNDLRSTFSRVRRGAFFDPNFSRIYRNHASLAIQVLLRKTYDLYQSQNTRPFEQFFPIVQRTFADFFCSASGDMVFKLPYLNHLPSPYSPWEPPAGMAFNEVLDSGCGELQMPDGFHGSEYILTSFGRKGRSFSFTSEGKFTRVKGNIGTHNVESVGDKTLWQKMQAVVQRAPTEMQAFFGANEFEVSASIPTFSNETLKMYIGAVLPMVNWRGNKLSVSYDIFKPWELGKTVYLPERDWLYRVNSLGYSYVRGSEARATLGCDFGHPARAILPLPWLLLYDGTKGSPELKKVISDIANKTIKEPWEQVEKLFISSYQGYSKELSGTNYVMDDGTGTDVASSVIFNAYDETVEATELIKQVEGEPDVAARPESVQ